MEDLDLTDEPSINIVDNPLAEVSEMDKFKLAKNILFSCLVLYCVIMLLFAFSNCLQIKDPMKEIWDFSSQGLFGIINLIIGFYFGGKIAKS